jgi:microcin C transport system substrate-binding protein
MLRTFTAFLVGLAMVGPPAGPGSAQDGAWRHATSLIGTPKYQEGFERFDYVNPDAPKGGRVRLSDTGSFDSLNFVPPRGSIPLGLGLIYDTLMTSAMDEVSTEYGLLADALKYPEDYSSVTYRLRDGAYWHDGEPVTPEDVVWSFQTLVEHNPGQAFYYQHVEKAEVTGPNEVTFTFDVTGNRELPQIVGQLMVLPKHYWESTDANGNPRDITRSTLEPPLGSGPYRVKSVTAGRTISYERVDDYWGKDLPVNIGQNNLGEIRYDYFLDETPELEAFKSGSIDFRTESTARVWATSYDFPAVRDGRVVLELFPQNYRSAGLMIGFIFNQNRGKFQDPRVRQAFNLAFPFEEINKSIFYGQYERLDSYFDGIELEATGLPEGRELEILEGLRGSIPEAVFTEDYTNPVNANPNDQRQNLRAALDLFNQAGWELQGRKLVNTGTGEPMTVEYLMNGPLFERIGLRYQTELRKIGVELSLRPVDTSQYENRVRSRDFDMIYSGWAQSMSPGNEQLEYFGTNSASRDGSRNYGAIRNEAVDAIIQEIILAKDRDDLVAATKALDRVLLWNHYLVPGWTLRATRTARWDYYGFPDPLPEYSYGFPTIWWWDEQKAAAVAARQ